MVNAMIKQLKNPLEVNTIRSEEFREVTQDRIFGGIREGYIIYTIQNERFNTSGEDDVEPVFVDEVQVKFSPQQLVKTYELFGRFIEQYENLFGEIKTIDKLASDNPDLLKES